MNSIDSHLDKLNFNKDAGYLASMARKAVLHSLSNLKIGYLVLEDGNDTYQFGNANDRIGFSAHIKVVNPNTYSRILSKGTIGVGEAYMSGWWTTNDLVKVIRIFVANQKQLNNMDNRFSQIGKGISSFLDYFQPNTIRSAKKKIGAHYDLNNDFFKLFLDREMMYSSAIYSDESMTLEQASEQKLHHICQRLQLQESDHLVEIGSGWGGMAIFAAKYYGCRVTTTTISDEQYQHAVDRVNLEKLEDKVNVLKKDYRLLEGKFDKLVSIEMVEAVGHKFYSTYFKKCNDLLKEDGLMLIQAITTLDQRFHREKNKIDFIRQYIFPGGCLPSNAVILDNIAKVTNLHLVGLEDITLDYAKTLADWRTRFFDHLSSVKEMGFSDTFIRLWDFYLSYCEGGFRERAISTSQLLFAKPGCKLIPQV